MKCIFFNALWIWFSLIAVELNAAPPELGITSAFGVNIHTGALLAGDLTRIHSAGFTWVRTDLTWQRVEHVKGKYDFSFFDRLTDGLRSQNLRVLAILDYGNSLYASPGEPSPFASQVNTEAFRRAYAAFSAAAVERYAGRGFIWEQWNEPNNEHAWPPKPSSDDYVALMKEACVEIRKKSPKEIIIGPASSYIDFAFIEACLRGGMLNYWSAISVHPYRRTEPETAASDFAKLRMLIARFAPPDRTVPIICGEWGYSSAWKEFDDFKQADYLAQMFHLNRRENIPLTIWYDWRDDGDDPNEPEHRFGLIRRSSIGSFEPKPAYFAVRKFLSGAQSTPQ